MTERDVIEKNLEIYNSGIDSGISKSPYRLSNKELDDLENKLNQIAEERGTKYVLVEWGQPFGGPISGSKYHPCAEIQTLLDNYKTYNTRGICPKAGLVVDINWIDEQRERLRKLEEQPIREFDLAEYWKFVRSVQF